MSVELAGALTLGIATALTIDIAGSYILASESDEDKSLLDYCDIYQFLSR